MNLFFFFLYILYSISVVFPIRFPNHIYTIHSYILKIQKREKKCIPKENPTLLSTKQSNRLVYSGKKDTTWTSFNKTPQLFFFLKEIKYIQSCRIWHKYKRGDSWIAVMWWCHTTIYWSTFFSSSSFILYINPKVNFIFLITFRLKICLVE